MSRTVLLLLVLVGCAGSKSAVQAPTDDDDAAPSEDIEIRIDSVGIGDPCAGKPTCATPTVRVSLRNGIHAAKVRVVSVTVKGAEGRTLTLPASKPTFFTRVGIYEPWNETIGPDQVMDVQYTLARVDWDHFGDRLDVYPTDVVVEVDGRERVFNMTRELRGTIDDNSSDDV